MQFIKSAFLIVLGLVSLALAERERTTYLLSDVLTPHRVRVVGDAPAL